MSEQNIQEQIQEQASKVSPEKLARFEKLREKLGKAWKKNLEKSQFAKLIMDGKFGKELYVQYLTETYHYTKHNAKNQALVAVRDSTSPFAYQRFCLHHALEELGHEHMALHDLQKVGVKIDEANMPPMLASSETLVAYLYWVSAFGNPLQRIGYSFWAESSYDYIQPLLEKTRQILGIGGPQMTFLVQHADIDEKHAEEVKEVMLQVVKSEKDWEDIERVMLQSLKLTFDVLEEIAENYISKQAQA